MQTSKKLLALDFDGVLHSYTSGWKGPRTIPDPPVPGALEFLTNAVTRFDVHIFSSRSRYIGGRWAMRRWLRDWYLRSDTIDNEWWSDFVSDYAIDLGGDSMAPWDANVRGAIDFILDRIEFPKYKPPAHVTIDDRAIPFVGIWPTPEAIESFSPWRVPRFKW